jgi:DNA repair exonuclease SbcCD nuclease subunit
MGAIVSVDGDKWPDTNPYVVSGHIHSRQSPQPNVYYPGSALQHAFGESEKNIIAVFTFDDDGYTKREVNLQLPRKKTLYMDVGDIGEFTTPDTEDKIRVTLSGNYDEFKAFRKTKKFKALSKDGVKVVFKPRKVKKKVVAEGETVEEEPEAKCEGFQLTLQELIMKEKNSRLVQSYEWVVNSKDTNIDDVLFL